MWASREVQLQLHQTGSMEVVVAVVCTRYGESVCMSIRLSSEAWPLVKLPCPAETMSTQLGLATTTSTGST